MRKLKSTLIVLLAGLTTAVVVASLLLTLFLPTLLQRLGCAPYGIRCAIGAASIHPRPNLTADLMIDHLTLFDPDGRSVALRVKRLAATLNIPSLILTRQVMPTDVRIDSPELLFRQLDDGRWNLLALAQEVQQHLQPATRPTTLLFPRTSITAGMIQIDSHQITDVNVTLEPKPDPLLLEMQAQATVGGRTVRISSALKHTLEGEIQALVQEERLRGAVRFRLDYPDRAVTIPDWSFEAEGALVRGNAAIRYGNWPPAYTLTVAQWQADLGTLARQFSLPWFSGFTGMMEGEPTTLQGHWPDLPVGQLAAIFKDGGLALPTQQLKISGLTGGMRLQRTETGLRLQAGLRGQALELLGQRHSNPSLQALISVDPTSGDVVTEELVASLSGAQIRAKGSGQRWGRDSLDVTTTDLRIEPTLLTQLFHLADRGVSITRLVDPSIHIWWPGTGRSWKAEIVSRSIQLHAAAISGAATLQRAQITVQWSGTSGRNLDGALAIEQADLPGRRLRALRARFEMDPDQVRISELHVATGDGDVQGHASFSRTAPLHEMRVALSVRGLRPQSLFAPTEKPAELLAIPFDAELSAALSHGLVTATIDLPPAVTEQLHQLILKSPPMASTGAASGHILLQAQGTLQSGHSVQASGSIRVRGLRELLAGGDPTNRVLPVELAVAYRDGLLTLKAHELDLSAAELSPMIGRLASRRIVGREGRLVISADATFGGSQPPTAGGAITFHGLSFNLAREKAEPTPLLTGIRGAVAFTLDKGLLTIPETALRTDEKLTLILTGSLPLGHNDPSAARVHLSVPWTEAAALRSPLTALTGGRPEATQLTGQLRADLELIGQEYHGALALRNVGIGSNFFHVDGATGVIPLYGRIDQGSTSPLHQVAARQKAGWSHLTEPEYRAALERLSNVPAKAPFSLTINSLRYDPIELRNIEIALASSENRIVVQRFAFAAWDGRWSGWGMVEPLSEGITLTLLTEGLSLRAICDAFPPITGYINGRINGMADLEIPHFALDQAQGSARFWAVDSPQEKRKISRTLIEQLAGQRIRYFSLFGVARRYDRGVLDVALKAGDLIFHELEISHTVLGFKDLDVRVSPSFNKIGVAHLIESISEAIERMRTSAKTNH
ncbi:MAG: hypothetical protein KGL31_01180 [candidate division NC10 bacterium]|nr:hypothetical protein [candidate division NC10 bacterium]MDE2320523.1 hypothetical protein [candidate division NC10 bacterium]